MRISDWSSDVCSSDLLPTEEKDYLEKILGAVRLNLEDVALLNYARYTDRKYAELKDFFAFGTLLLFGVSPHALQVPGPVLPYHLGLVEAVRILATDGTEVFRPDNENKKQIWTEIKRKIGRAACRERDCQDA